MADAGTPVLIVGGGPTGLSLSIELGWRGVRHILIDRAPSTARAEHPRMDQVSVRSMEHVRRWGALADVEAAGFPRDIRRDIVFATGVIGHELDREPVQSDLLRAPTDASPQKHELCPQNFFDPALQRVAARSPLAELRHGERLVALMQDAGSVTADVEDADGATRRVRASFLVGCDGAGGDTARLLGLEAGAATLLARSTNIFFRSAELTRRAAERPGYRYILLDEAGVWASTVLMNGRDVWRLQVLGGDARAEWSEAEIAALVIKAMGAAVPFELVSTVPWARREYVADRFAAGRCFLAGDAAHQLSPTGGYGMNTGIGDAVDLGWKIAAVLDGWAGPRLLASYEAERRPVAVRNAARATVNFRRMREVASDPALLAPGDAGEAARARVGGRVRAAMAQEWESLGIHLGYSYAGSPVIVGDGASEPPDDPARFVATTRPGARAPHAWLAPGRSTLDLFGRGFVLLAFAPDADPAPLVAAATARGLPLTVQRIDDPAVARLYERALVLVRPDGHVAWRGERIGADAGAIIDTVRGA